MRRPDFPLSEAVGWFLADKAQDVQDTTLRTYRGWLGQFCTQLPEAERVLGSLNVEQAERFVRTAKNQNTRMNKTIALRSFARYLMEKRLWYAGTDDVPLSVLHRLKQPQPTPYGLPPYTDAEVRAILRAVDSEPHRLRNLAVVAVLLHGFRAKEIRLMSRRAVILPTFREQGHFVIDEERRTKRGTRGVREVPMDPDAKDVIRDYIRLARPEYRGTGEELLLLTLSGHAFTASGWGLDGSSAQASGEAGDGHPVPTAPVPLDPDAAAPRGGLAGFRDHRSPGLERRLR